MNFIKSLGVTLLMMLPLFASGQESVDFLRSTGKIYSVVLAVVILFLGIVIYVWRLDRKVSQMEQEFQNRIS